MTAAPSTTTPTKPSTTRRPQWLRVLFPMLRAFLGQTLWFWAFVVAAEIVMIIILQRTGNLESSIVQYARYGAIWYPFAFALGILAIQFSRHVASGLTRRSFIRAILISTVATGVAYAVLMTLAMLLEGAVFSGLGMGPFSGGRSGPILPHGGIVLVNSALSVTAGGVSGLLAGIAFYRGGALRGTLSLPLTVAPAVTVMLLTTDVYTTTLFTVVLALALIIGAAIAFHLLARAAPITRAMVTP